MTTRPEQVFDFLKLKRSVFYCDDCIAKVLKMPNRIAVQHITASLALCSEFTRTKALCNVCRNDRKLAIKAN